MESSSATGHGGNAASHASSVLTKPFSLWTVRAEDLSPELRKELERLEKLFTVDTNMLKKITRRFGEELEQGKCEWIQQTGISRGILNCPTSNDWAGCISYGRRQGVDEDGLHPTKVKSLGCSAFTQPK